MSSVGQDHDISSTKVDPLASDQKYNKEAAKAEAGVIGTDSTVDQARIDPVGGKGQYQNPAPHADTGGVVGHDNTVAGAKIDPLVEQAAASQSQKVKGGLEDEDVDSARIQPLGEVREEMPKTQ